MRRWVLGWVWVVLMLSACNLGRAPLADDAASFQATLPPDVPNAPVYSPTPTPSLTPTLTATPQVTPTATLPPTSTASPEPTATLTPAFSPTPSATPGLIVPTLPAPVNLPAAYVNPPADFAPATGWSCEDFPCADDIAGFMQRIRVPAGYTLEHIGQFPGQPVQITYGPDGWLYATVLEDGTRYGAVYALDTDVGSVVRYAPADGEFFVSPFGLAFRPGTDVLYVSARRTLEAGGRLWRVRSDGVSEPLDIELPCCFTLIDNQPNGLIFGPDGYLYLGLGALTDRLEPEDPRLGNLAERHPLEAAVLRIHPHIGLVAVFASGIRNPVDLAMDSTGQLYATDNGLVNGPGDRLVRLAQGANYGWPFYGDRGCFDCPPRDLSLTITPDLLRFPDYTLPRGLVAYTGTQFPQNVWDHLFIALWNGTASSQRVVRVDPRAIPDPTNFTPEPFVTGLIRPTDVTIAPDGTLVIADYVYGHVWRVRYTG